MAEFKVGPVFDLGGIELFQCYYPAKLISRPFFPKQTGSRTIFVLKSAKSLDQRSLSNAYGLRFKLTPKIVRERTNATD